MMVVIPLLMTVLIAVAAAYFMFERKSLAQSACVQEAVRLQKELGTSLEKLIALNPQARVLRKQRTLAERALKIARASKHPAAIATAEANLLAVILAQVQHRSRQQSLLLDAKLARARYARNLRSNLKRLKISKFESREYYISALAVRPVPFSSLTPDYVQAQPFGYLQQHRFRFQVDLKPSFFPSDWDPKIRQKLRANMKQDMECSTTLTSENKKWNVRILAASARSSL